MSPPVRRAFRPVQPPQVVHDHVLHGPALLVGWWCDADGRQVEAAVATMVSPRQPGQISLYPAAPRAAPKEATSDAQE